MTAKRKKLLMSLLKRLKEVHVPKEAMFPTLMDNIVTGGLMIVAWRRRYPCGCPLCNGHHEKVIVFAAPSTTKTLEQLFNE